MVPIIVLLQIIVIIVLKWDGIVFLAPQEVLVFHQFSLNLSSFL